MQFSFSCSPAPLTAIIRESIHTLRRYVTNTTYFMFNEGWRNAAISPMKQFMSLPAPRILIAANDPVISAVLGPKLRRVGFQVLNALDSQAVLQLPKLRVPSLIVLDERMRAINAMEICRRLAGSAITADVPVILLTALAVQETVPQNVRRIVAKPFSAKALIESIQQILATPSRSAVSASADASFHTS